MIIPAVFRLAKCHLATIVIPTTLLLIAMFSSCRSSQQVTSVTEPSEVSTASLHERFDSVMSGYVEWQTVKAPLKVTLSEPTAFSVSGTAIMERGKSIYFSFRFLGMEVATIHITGDSIIAVDKFHKKYLAERISEILSGFNIGIDNIQDMLLGRAFIIGEASPFNYRDVKLTAEKSDWVMLPKKQPRNARYQFDFSSANLLTALIVSPGANPPVKCEYGAHTLSTRGVFAGSADITAGIGNKKLDISILWNLGKAGWDNPSDIKKPNIPKGFERVDVSAMLKTVSSI